MQGLLEEREQPETEDQLVMLRQPSTVDILLRVDELLEARYSSADLGNQADPLDELIYIILSIQTAERGFRQSFKQLRVRFRTWRRVLETPTETLVSILTPFGLARQKAPRIKAILQAVLEDAKAHARRSGRDPDRVREPTLGFLAGMPDDKAERYLVSLPGVGRKVARCVLLYSLGKAVFPVDTNVYRIMTRLGILPHMPWKRAHDLFQKVVPPSIRRRLHVNMVHHGRAICTPRGPKCTACPLISFCKFGLQTHRSRRKQGPAAIDLFAGAGSRSAGFRLAGWDLRLAVERSRDAAQSYRHNNPGVPVLEMPVECLNPAAVLRTAGGRRGSIDAIIAGPPCQGYSAAGRRNPKETRNFL